MASSSPAPTGTPATTQRVSGRVRRVPEQYVPSPTTTTSKRKRTTENDDNDQEDVDDEQDSEKADSDEDSEAQEEARNRKQRGRKTKASAPKKPALKKPRVNGTSLPLRPTSTVAAPKKKAPKKVKLKAPDTSDAGGLYSEIFSSDEDVEKIIAEWVTRFQDAEADATAELVNLVLRCIAPGLTVDGHAMEDPDGTTSKINDLQEEYQATNPSDYPLIQKSQTSNAIKHGLSTFFKTLVRTIAVKGILIENPAFIENMACWFSAMSSAPNRPFRHTATFVSLNIITSLCSAAHTNATTLASDRKHAETEQNKARPNKARVQQLEQRARTKQDEQDIYDGMVKDWFETVFIHRYRDVDSVIRQESIAALGQWIFIHPDYFFNGAHLRYFGWVLGDPSPNTRGEVVKQLLKLYDQQALLSGLSQFTEKFRARMVEIATTDADIGVRVSGIELMDRLRACGMLEPDDIDAVGRLIFDSDVRVRKAVAAFFAACVTDSYDAKLDDLGGLESVQESLPDVEPDDFDSPQLEWLKLKALAELLSAYDYDEELPSQVARSAGSRGFLLSPTGADSRFMLATEMLYDRLDELEVWETTAGYLLYDFSRKTKDKSLMQLTQECTLDSKEEMILLETLNTSVRRFLTDIAAKLNAKSKPSKKDRDELLTHQESAVHHLTVLIPQLLKKFGDVPSTAGSILRMESVLNLPSLKDLRQDSDTFGALMDMVRKQFMSHGTDEVLGPASNAILHAKSYGELDDLTEEKLAKFWDDVVGNFTELIDVKTVSVRGASRLEELTALSNNLLRVIRLSAVSDCTETLEDTTYAVTNKSTKQMYSGPIDLIMALIQRAIPASGPSIDEEEASYEDEVAARATEASLFYFRWKVRAVVAAITDPGSAGYPYDDLVALASRRDTYVDFMTAAVRSRKAREDVCVALMGNTLELYTLFSILREVEIRPSVSNDFLELVLELDDERLALVMKVFSATERVYGKLSGKKLEMPSRQQEDEDEDVDAIQEDPLSDSESEAEVNEATQSQTQASQYRKETKVLQTLLAEQKLCVLTGKIVQAVLATVVPAQSVKRRLERHKTRLGPNYKDCVAYLDAERDAKKKAASKKSAAKKTKAQTGGGKPSAKSSAIVVDDASIDDDIEDEDDEQDGEEEGLARSGLQDRVVDEEEDENVDEEAANGGAEDEDSMGEE